LDIQAHAGARHKGLQQNSRIEGENNKTLLNETTETRGNKKA
jgi:hypothetical protein